MFSFNTKTLVSLMAAGAISVSALAGCTTATSGSDTSQQSENRTYLTQVNQLMETLDSRLDSFTDAVSRDDVVSMRTQADNAFKTLDDLADLDTPDTLKDVQESYKQGTSDLKDALNSYIDLYTEVQNATDEAPFDWSSYEGRIADIKTLYDKGIGELQDADDAAAKLPK